MRRVGDLILSATFFWFSEWEERRRIALSLLIAVLCFVFAVLAQRRLDRELIDYSAFVPYGVAGTLFALAFGEIALERSLYPEQAGDPLLSRSIRSIGLVAISLALALVGCLNFGGNRFRLLGLILWAGGLFVCLSYLYISERVTAFGQRLAGVFSNRPLSISRVGLVLGAVTLVGAALRLYGLDAIPADIGWDLPYNYTDALSILRGEYRIFFPANQGREGLFFYLIALVARLATLSHFSIKLTSALVGIATIPVLYLAGRKLFDTSVGLVAAALLAVNRWHIVLSRSGFRVIMLPLFTILLVYAVVRALRTRSPFDFAFAGLTMGLGLYTYTAFLFAALAVPAGLALLSLSKRPPNWRSLVPLVALMLGVAVVVYAPLARFAIEHPDQYLRRIGLQVQLVGGGVPERPRVTLPLLSENVRTSLLMYHAYGDSNVRFNVPSARHFGFVSGVLLVLGLAYTLRRWRQAANVILLVFFVSLIVPMTLAMLPREMPNVFRAAGTIGPALILSALPLVVLSRRLHKLGATYPASDLVATLRLSSPDEAYEFILRTGRRGLLAVAPALIAGTLLAVEFRETRQFYFHEFVQVLPDKQNVSIAKEMARQMEAYGDLSSSYIKVWPHWFDGRALQVYLRRQYGAWNPEFDRFIPGQPPLSTITEGGLVIVHPDDTAGLEFIAQEFPRHATAVHVLPGGTPAFITVYVER